MRSPGDALNLGIGMIYQHFKLVKPFTVAENIVLGMERVKILKTRELEKQVKELSEEYKIKINPSSAIWQLSIGEQQRVEILKILYRKADILILDEPTAVLTPDEVKELFGTLKNMAERGCTIIFITHKMNEVMEYADRIRNDRSRTGPADGGKRNLHGKEKYEKYYQRGSCFKGQGYFGFE